LQTKMVPDRGPDARAHMSVVLVLHPRFSRVFHALCSVPETPKGREPSFGSPALGSILVLWI
jgi:hypothetical protein